MAQLIRKETNKKNIYTYFEFDGYDKWDDFDKLLYILINQMDCKITDKLEGIYSRHYFLDINGVSFKLLYHEDFGNCFCNQEKKEENYYNLLEGIANEVLIKANELYSRNYWGGYEYTNTNMTPF